jgi:hypothetical protein
MLMRVWRIHLPNHREVGWRVQYSLLGRQKTKLFADKKYGGSDGARRAAEEFAMANFTEHHELMALNRRLRPRKNTQLDVPGVGRYKTKTGRAFWIATWTCNGKRLMRKFSVSIHGEEVAQQLAFECRSRMIVDDIKRRAELVEKYTPEVEA